VNCGPGHIQCIYSSTNSVTQYSTERICAAIVDITTIQCMLNYKHGAKYSAHPPVTLHELWFQPYTKYLQLRIFRLQYSTVGICAGIVDITSIQRFILQTWCQMQRTYSSFLYVNSGPAHLQSIYSSAYICFNFRWNVSALLLEIVGHFEGRYTANLEANIAHIIRFTLCVLWSKSYTT
jgi:hypothetical protein